MMEALPVGVVGLIAAAGFAGMALFLFNMGRDMSAMTKSVVQMGQDVTSMATDMRRMAVDINKFTRPESIMTPFR